MTKTEKIKNLLKLDLTTKQIAERVGCRKEYVRVVKQRVAGGGLAKADLKYLSRPDVKLKRNHYNAERYWQDTGFRERMLERQRSYRARQRAA